MLVFQIRLLVYITQSEKSIMEDVLGYVALLTMHVTYDIDLQLNCLWCSCHLTTSIVWLLASLHAFWCDKRQLIIIKFSFLWWLFLVRGTSTLVFTLHFIYQQKSRVGYTTLNSYSCSKAQEYQIPGFVDRLQRVWRTT